MFIASMPVKCTLIMLEEFDNEGFENACLWSKT